MRTDGEKGYVFINHYQRLCCLEDVLGAVIDTGTVIFPPMDVCGEISFFFPFMMELKGKNHQSVTLQYATAQPVCRMGNVFFFVEIPGIEPEYCFLNGSKVRACAGRDNGFFIDGIQMITLTWEEARFLRRLDGDDHQVVYLGNGCDLYVKDGSLYSAEEGQYICYRFDGEKFQPFCIGEPYIEPELTRQRAETPDFEMPHAQELQIGEPRKVTWERLTVTGDQGFVAIEGEYDTAQIYADGCLIADNYYYGLPWKVPAHLLYQKECYLAMSELKNDFYREREYGK